MYTKVKIYVKAELPNASKTKSAFSFCISALEDV